MGPPFDVVLHEHPASRATSLEAFWPLFVESARHLDAPIDRAFAAGALAPTVGLAFAGGYQAALLRLLGADALRGDQGDQGDQPPGLDAHTPGIASLLVTERGGNHPRAIETTLVTVDDDHVVLTGTKTFATCGPLATRLLVAAREGEHDDARPRLRLVAVPANAPGVHVRPSPPTPFAADVPHALVELDRVTLPAAAVLPGDGYAAHVKPFRTVEDLHVTAAVVGHLARTTHRHGLAPALLGECLALATATRPLALDSPDDPLVHVSTHGVIALASQVFGRVVEALRAVDAAAAARLEIEAPLLTVARGARERRLAVALRALEASPRDGASVGVARGQQIGERVVAGRG